MKRTVAFLVESVATEFEVSVPDLLANSRGERSVAVARCCLYYLARNVTSPKLSYPQIGRELSRDHTTVMSGEKKHLMRMMRSQEEVDRTNRVIARLERQRAAWIAQALSDGESIDVVRLRAIIEEAIAESECTKEKVEASAAE